MYKKGDLTLGEEMDSRTEDYDYVKGAYLCHSCDSWVIGRIEQVDALILDLQAIRKIMVEEKIMSQRLPMSPWEVLCICGHSKADHRLFLPTRCRNLKCRCMKFNPDSNQLHYGNHYGNSKFTNLITVENRILPLAIICHNRRSVCGLI